MNMESISFNDYVLQMLLASLQVLQKSYCAEQFVKCPCGMSQYNNYVNFSNVQGESARYI